MALEAGLREELEKYIRRYYSGPPEEGFMGKSTVKAQVLGSSLGRSMRLLEFLGDTVQKKVRAGGKAKKEPPYFEADTVGEAAEPCIGAPCLRKPAKRTAKPDKVAERCFEAPSMSVEDTDCLSEEGLSELVERTEKGFSETVLKLIDARGFSDSEVYKRAGLDRRHFSKIRSNRAYRPTKETALALAIALRLSLAETQDLLQRAGYALSHSSRADIIVEYFIVRRVYDRFVINEALADYAQPLIGA